MYLILATPSFGTVGTNMHTQDGVELAPMLRMTSDLRWVWLNVC